MLPTCPYGTKFRRGVVSKPLGIKLREIHDKPYTWVMRCDGNVTTLDFLHHCDRSLILMSELFSNPP